MTAIGVNQNNTLTPAKKGELAALPLRDSSGNASSHSAVRRALSADRGQAGLARSDSNSQLWEVWQQTQPELLRLAAALGAGSSLSGVSAADVLQDVYIKACQQDIKQFKGDELRRWLFRVTINRCKLEGRKQSRWKRVWQTLIGGDQKRSSDASNHSQTPQQETNAQNTNNPDAAGTAIQREHQQLIRQALDEMSSEAREVLVLRYFHDQNSRQIAEILEVSDSTIRGRLRTARRLLAAALNAKGIHE